MEFPQIEESSSQVQKKQAKFNKFLSSYRSKSQQRQAGIWRERRTSWLKLRDKDNRGTTRDITPVKSTVIHQNLHSSICEENENAYSDKIETGGKGTEHNTSTQGFNSSPYQINMKAYFNSYNNHSNIRSISKKEQLIKVTDDKTLRDRKKQEEVNRIKTIYEQNVTTSHKAKINLQYKKVMDQKKGQKSERISGWAGGGMIYTKQSTVALQNVRKIQLPPLKQLQQINNRADRNQQAITFQPKGEITIDSSFYKGQADLNVSLIKINQKFEELSKQLTLQQVISTKTMQKMTSENRQNTKASLDNFAQLNGHTNTADLSNQITGRSRAAAIGQLESMGDEESSRSLVTVAEIKQI